MRDWTHKRHPTLAGELCGVFCDDFGEKWTRYNGTALYIALKGYFAEIISTLDMFKLIAVAFEILINML